MAGSPTGTRTQQIAYYEQYIAKLPGSYEGSNTAFKGKSWTAIYQYLLAKDPSADPKTIGGDVVGIWALQQTAAGLKNAAGQLGPFISQAENAAAQTNFAAGIPNPLASLAGFLGDLTSRNLWLRVAKIVAGLALVIIGVAQLTHAQNIAKTVAKGAVLA